jgi:hypothetical protein
MAVLSPGALLLRWRSRFGHGFRVAWYRDVVRPRILRTNPVKTAGTDTLSEIHVLTSAGDWMNLMWTLKSLYRVSRKQYPLVIHEDGTVPEHGIKALRRHFPEARLIPRKQADAEVDHALRDYPRAREMRRKLVLSMKVFDFLHYAQSPRLFLLDSDVLFFAPPTVLEDRLESADYLLNSVNRDVSTAYSIPPERLRELCDFPIVERFNSGLGVIHLASLQLDWIEKFLGFSGILDHGWRYEQTVFALCSCRFGTELLPEDYDVFLKGEVGERPSRHYVGAIRHLMYGEGIRRLVKAGMLKVD